MKYAVKRQGNVIHALHILNKGAWGVVTISDQGKDSEDRIAWRFGEGDRLSVCTGMFRKKDAKVIGRRVVEIGGKFFEAYSVTDSDGNEYCVTLNAVEDISFRTLNAQTHRFCGVGYSSVCAFC